LDIAKDINDNFVKDPGRLAGIFLLSFILGARAGCQQYSRPSWHQHSFANVFHNGGGAVLASIPGSKSF
jgi:hypothetical protein